MGNDISLIDEEFKLNTRVAILIENEGKFMLIDAGNNADGKYYRYYTKNGIAWITPKDLSVSHLKFTAKGETDITELGYKNSSAKIMPRGSVLFSSRAPIGYIYIAKQDI